MCSKKEERLDLVSSICLYMPPFNAMQNSKSFTPEASLKKFPKASHHKQKKQERNLKTPTFREKL